MKRGFLKKAGTCLLACALAFGAAGTAGCAEKGAVSDGLAAYYSFDEGEGSYAKEKVSGKTHEIYNVYAASNQQNLMKPSGEPLWREGVKGSCLYMDG
ncbi:MAG: hypothetical protein ACLUHK_08210, partial [Eubacteriales bacterium]